MFFIKQFCRLLDRGCVALRIYAGYMVLRWRKRYLHHEIAAQRWAHQHLFTAQLLYEVTDPHAYLTPDVTADFSGVEIAESAPHTITVKGARGRKRPDTLTVSVGSNGSVSSTDGKISNCRGTCTASYSSAASVTLNATGDSGYSFAGWGGACSGTGTCSLTMDANKTVACRLYTTDDADELLSVGIGGCCLMNTN